LVAHIPRIAAAARTLPTGLCGTRIQSGDRNVGLARRRFFEEVVRQQRTKGKGGYLLLSTSNLYLTGGLVTSPGRAA
jgi:hypothetical protein